MLYLVLLEDLLILVEDSYKRGIEAILECYCLGLWLLLENLFWAKSYNEKRKSCLCGKG